VHDARTRHLRKLRCVVQQRIEQGALPVAAGRMHHQSHRLVDDQNAVVFKHDVERDVFGLIGQFRGMRLRPYHHDLAAPHLLLAVGGRAVQRDQSFGNPFLQAAARIFRQLLRQNLVETHAAEFHGQRQFQRNRRGGSLLVFQFLIVLRNCRQRLLSSELPTFGIIVGHFVLGFRHAP
jgi:hypothetical protein